jgi:hypothetical protein
VTTPSITGLSANFNILTALAQSYSSNAQLTTQEQLDIIDSRLKAKLKDQIAAVQANDAPDNALQTSTQADVTRLKKQLSTIEATQTQFSTNSNVLADINIRLSALQTAITAGDSAGFDTALGIANTDVGNLLVISPTAPFQPDGILGLKGTGLGIKNSSTYNLSTPAGQAAAQTDVNNAQALIGQLFPATTNNILVAGDVATALGNQINLQVATLNQLQNSSQTQIDAETANLTQLEQNQEHIIQLNLGNTTLLSDELGTIANPPPLPTSAFDVLSNAVGATAASVNTALNSSTPAILSLLV